MQTLLINSHNAFPTSYEINHCITGDSQVMGIMHTMKIHTVYMHQMKPGALLTWAFGAHILLGFLLGAPGEQHLQTFLGCLGN